MKTLAIGELEAQFSEILEKVKNGESFGILSGKKKTPIAMIVSLQEKRRKENLESLTEK